MKLTEKQKLLKRLKAFCGMLGDDLQKLDADLLTRLEDTIRRLGATTKIAIGGLPDSKHRAVGEFLLGEKLFETAEDEEKCPGIQVRYGSEAKTHAMFGETRKTYPGLSLSPALAGKTPTAIGLEVPNPITADISFMILPSYDGDDHRAGYLVNLLDDTESIVWCSNATEIWQPRERRLWFTVPDTLKERSILALTGAENLTNDDARRVLEEKSAFVSDEFRFFSTLSTDAAKAATKNGNIVDPEKFTASGGEALLKQIMSLVHASQASLLEEAREVRTEIDKIPLGSSQPVPAAPLPTAPAAPKESAEEALKATLLAGVRRCESAVEQCGTNDYGALFEAMNDLLAAMSKAVRGDIKFEREQDLVAAQVDEAAELVGLLSYENNEKASREAADTVRQITLDIWSRLPGTMSEDTQNISDPTSFSKAS